jgi:hypothetical protein
LHSRCFLGARGGGYTRLRYLVGLPAAAQLHAERDAWLNPTPPPSPPRARGGERGEGLKRRTLTNLYNALAVLRADSGLKPTVPAKPTVSRLVPAAADFAPRLDELHQALDRAVCDAYGWECAILEDDEEILRLLLALNLARAAGQ